MSDILREAITDARTIKDIALDNAKKAINETLESRLINMIDDNIKKYVNEEDDIELGDEDEDVVIDIKVEKDKDKDNQINESNMLKRKNKYLHEEEDKEKNKKEEKKKDIKEEEDDDVDFEDDEKEDEEGDDEEVKEMSVTELRKEIRDMLEELMEKVDPEDVEKFVNEVKESIIDSLKEYIDEEDEDALTLDEIEKVIDEEIQSFVDYIKNPDKEDEEEGDKEEPELNDDFDEFMGNEDEDSDFSFNEHDEHGTDDEDEDIIKDVLNKSLKEAQRSKKKNKGQYPGENHMAKDKTADNTWARGKVKKGQLDPNVKARRALKKMKESLMKSYKVINEMENELKKEKLNKYKLYFYSKLLSEHYLTRDQKSRFGNMFAKCDTAKRVKDTYIMIKEALKDAGTKKYLPERLQSSSKPISATEKSRIITESPEFVRMQQLAGIRRLDD